MSAPRLFDFAAFDEASLHPEHSPWRRLVTSEDPDVVALRAVLERCWAHAGASQVSLRAGLAHVRWGQHAGALAQLLALGLALHEGFDVTSEPQLSGRTPDLLLERDGVRTLVEVRAITGAGLQPWDDSPAPPRAPPARTSSRAGDERARRAAARKAAAQRAEAEAAAQRDLAESVAAVLHKKARTYAELCAEHDLPLVLALYEDTDDQLATHAANWLDVGAPAHVAGVLVFGRETEAPPVRVRGSWWPRVGGAESLGADPFPSLALRGATARPFELALPPGDG